MTYSPEVCYLLRKYKWKSYNILRKNLKYRNEKKNWIHNIIIPLPEYYCYDIIISFLSSKLDSNCIIIYLPRPCWHLFLISRKFTMNSKVYFMKVFLLFRKYNVEWCKINGMSLNAERFGKITFSLNRVRYSHKNE